MSRRPDRSVLVSRLTRWVRRRRRVVAAGLAALGVLLAMTALVPGAEPTAQVIVAARDLQPGEPLAADALDEMRIPASAMPPGAVATREALVGRIVTGPVAAGEVITLTRLLSDDSPGDGRVGVPIRVADEQIAALLTPGDLVDVVAVLDGTARRLATAARVVTVPRRPAAFGSGSTAGAVVIVAVAPESALTLASITTPAGVILHSGARGEDASVTAESARS